MSVLLGIPTNGQISARTAFSIFNLKGDFNLSMQIGCDVAHNRNKLVQQAMDYSHLLFVDSDMSFEPDTLQRMLAHNKDILGLAANHRRLPLESVVKPLKKTDENKPLPTKLFQAASCGTGVMLIKTSVFKKIPAPWFEFSYDDNGERVGEDVNFCRKASRAGIAIWVDSTIPCQHWGDFAY